jgi:hypothetical protein
MHHCIAERYNGARAAVVGGDARALDACGRAASDHVRVAAHISLAHIEARDGTRRTPRPPRARGPRCPRAAVAPRARGNARARAERGAPNQCGPRDRVGRRTSLIARGAQPHASPQTRVAMRLAGARTTRVRLPRPAGCDGAPGASSQSLRPLSQAVATSSRPRTNVGMSSAPREHVAWDRARRMLCGRA